MAVNMIADHNLRSIPCIIWMIPVIILLIACGRLPYGYYTFTRVATSGIAISIAIFGLRERHLLKAWSLVFFAIAVLFNPARPIYLHRSTWLFLDLATAATFCAHLIFVRLRNSNGER
jgi:hypothetical protein